MHIRQFARSALSRALPCSKSDADAALAARSSRAADSAPRSRGWRQAPGGCPRWLRAWNRASPRPAAAATAMISSAASRAAGSGNSAIVAATRMPLQRDRTGIGGRGRQRGLHRYPVHGVVSVKIRLYADYGAEFRGLKIQLHDCAREESM